MLRGATRTEIDGVEREIGVGDVLAIKHGTAHGMSNDGREPVLMRWLTTPSRRTLASFRELAAIRRGEPLSDPATLLEPYRDVFQLAEA